MRTKQKALYILTFIIGTIFSNLAMAELAVIVHPSNNDSLSNEDIEKLYLGKTNKFPGGTTALPLDRPEGSSLRMDFVDKVLGKSEAQLKSYWARLIFTGKGIPPKVIAADQEVIDMVSRNPDTIGFVDASSVTDKVKVLSRY